MKERAPDRRTSCAHYGCLPETLIACDGGGADQTTGEMEWRWLNGETVGGSERSSFRPHHVCHFGVQTGCGNSILYQLTVELRYTDSAQVASCINTPSLVEGVEMHHSSTTDSSCCGPAAVGRTMFTPSGAGIIQPSVGDGTRCVTFGLHGGTLTPSHSRSLMVLHPVLQRQEGNAPGNRTRATSVGNALKVKTRCAVAS